MKPKIQLVGGCATSSFVNEVASAHIPESGNDSDNSAPLRAGEAGVLMEGMLATIIRAANAEAGIVRMLSPDGNELRAVGCSGLPDKICQCESVVGAGCGVCGKSVENNTVAFADADFCRSRYGADFYSESCKFVLAVPFGETENADVPAGIVTLFFASEQSNADGMKHMLKTSAELLHIALKSVWQNEDKHQVDLLAERQSIANEIHDSLAQTLYFAKIRSSLLMDALKSDNDLLAYKCAQDIDEALDGSQKTVRELVTHFRCQMDPRGLQFALQKLVQDFIARTGIVLEYDNQVDEIILPQEYELQIFLIVREALVNVATHSGATIARLSVACVENQYVFIVEDDGVGVEGGAPAEGHYGLAIMRERALRIGGEVEVENLQGLGTRVQLIFGAPEA